MADIYKPDATHVVTGMARLSYVNIFTPILKDGQTKPKYYLTVLIPKHDGATMARIQAAVAAAREKGVSKCWNGVQIDAQAPIYDGDGVRPKDRTPFSAECRGHWVLNCSCGSDRKPDVVDANGSPILNESIVFSGCYGRVSLDFYPYANNGNKGIGCGLGNVQKLQDGERLGGGWSAEQDFGATGDSDLHGASAYPAQAAYQPQASAYPAQAAYQPQAPAYPAQAAYQPQAPAYPAQAAYQPQASAYPAQTVLNPITGLPM